MKKAIIVIVGILTLSAAACGGDSSSSPVGPSPAPSPSPSPSPTPEPTPAPTPTPTPSPTPPPTPPPSGPFTQTITGTADRFENAFHDLTAPRAGTATMTLSWANGRDDFDLALTEPTCRIDDYGCPIIVEDPDTPYDRTSAQVSIELTEGQTVRIWLANFNPRSTAYTLGIEIR